MHEPIKQLAELSLEVHPDILDTIAQDLLNGKFRTDRIDLNHSLKNIFSKSLSSLIKVIGEKESGIAIKSFAAISRSFSNIVNTEIVWTGPRSELVPSRRTEQVLLDIISQAKEKLFLVSYVFYEVDTVISELKKAISRGVSIKFLMEAPKELGGNVDHCGITLVKSQLPEIDVYIWDPLAKSEAGAQYASVHAKCAVADSNICLVTSANLTDSALKRNMELGLLVSGGPTPKSLHSHLLSLTHLRKVSPI